MQNEMCEWSERERQVLDLIAKGRTNAEIAAELGITFPTAKWYVSELISKLGVASREEVADYWRRERGLRRRLQRAMRALFAPVVLKAGAGVAGVAAVGVVSVALVAASGNAAHQPDDPEPTREILLVVPTLTPQPTPQLVRVEPCDIETLRMSNLLSRVRKVSEFPGCDLRGADMKMANMNDTDMSGANLAGADLSGATAGKANFTGANLENVVALPSVFTGANFTDANLRGAHMGGAIFGGNIWQNTTCPDGSNSDDHGSTCLGTLMLEDTPNTFSTKDSPMPPPGTCEHYVPLHHLPPETYHCDRTMFPVLAGHTDEVCDLRGLDLRYQYLDFADFAGCNLAGVDLSYAQLAYADLTGANLQGANLSHTVMVATKLDGANLEGATLDYAYLRLMLLTDTNLRGATTTGARLDIGWSNGTCPDGSPADDPARRVKGCQ